MTKEPKEMKRKDWIKQINNITIKRFLREYIVETPNREICRSFKRFEDAVQYAQKVTNLIK